MLKTTTEKSNLAKVRQNYLMFRSKNNKNLFSRLFSTKFLDDLDYQANLTPMRSPRPTPQVRQPVRSNNLQPFKSTEAVAYIQNIRNEVERQSNPSKDSFEESLFNSATLNFTEKFYDEEIENFIKKITNETLNENLKESAAMEEPVLRVYDKIYDIVANDMLADIAAEVLGQEMKRIGEINDKEIKKIAKDELVSNLMLDHMLDKIVHHGRVNGENGDINKILDGELIELCEVKFEILDF